MTSTECTFRPICRTPERPDVTPSRAFCRQLFGPIDHSQLQSDLKRELTKLSQETTTRWNFDFKNDQPLEGRYRWFKVECKEPKAGVSPSSVSSRTEESNVCGRDAVVERPRDVIDVDDQDASEDISNVAAFKQELQVLQNDKEFPPRYSAKKRPSSGKITEFLRKKKKRSSESSTVKSEPLPSRLRRPGKQPQSCLDRFISRGKL